ncbi:hypothetical protein NEOLEDRAFT_657329 [Neolentinus lepideus HHB14362 ss-1]|uniref:Uncharacterized protein n=1 Tax=Neolentinus lepideus HHB14362 ss-1 TaxID=1314782 RepID=A0A165QFR9_9AGAM|nr:hypothetical protein NEOLEDRAFT_657329 [Neolentinus lepideus HHB14362 ss-1]
MAPVSKAKAAGVSASSFLDLKAELAKHEEHSSKTKGPRNTPLYAGPSKNKGIEGRVKRDMIELEAVSKPTLEKARAVLERKAKIYDKLRKGKSAGLSDKQFDALLVDFDQNVPSILPDESDSDDVDESLTVPKPPAGEDDDPIVEYEDEFGRMRMARKSEVPRHLAPPESNAIDEILGDDSDVIYNPVNHLPIYEPSQERITQIQSTLSEESNPLNIHYDASAEVRAKGAAFYQFSGDEETRKRQMEELRQAREETERVRKEAGAVDVRMGEIEGMREAGGGKSRAMEKRKREIEERRKVLEAKRRKVKGGAEEAVVQQSVESAASSMGDGAGSESPASHARISTVAQDLDPFTTLEVQSASSARKDRSTGKSKEESVAPVDPADAFLAQLEMDMLKRR